MNSTKNSKSTTSEVSENNRKVLLSITDLKKYFPVKKSRLFQKEQLYVRANDGITLDIYEGETFGLVGESGCGKSTFGRVLLQLYPQTGGSTFFYGRRLSEFPGKYVFSVINRSHRIMAKVARERAAGGVSERTDADLAYCARIMGGLLVDETGEGARLLTAYYKSVLAAFKLSLKAAQKATYSKKSPVSDPRLEAEIDAGKKKQDALLAAVALRKEKLRSHPDFSRFEDMLDDGIDLARLKYSEIRHLRRDIQLIFQDPYSSLNPRMTVGQIVGEGLSAHKIYRPGSEKMQAHVVDTMLRCGLDDYMLHRFPHQFSGGQRQRICIARALAVDPKFVVCDEAVSALDVSIQSQIINLLVDLKKRQNLTYLFISHDLSVVKYISDRIGVMYLGEIVELCGKDELFSDPRHPYTVALLSSIPTTDPDDNRERILLEGGIPSPVRPPSGCKFHTRCFMAQDCCKTDKPPLSELSPGHFVACHFPERKLGEDGFLVGKAAEFVHRGDSAVAAD